MILCGMCLRSCWGRSHEAWTRPTERGSRHACSMAGCLIFLISAGTFLLCRRTNVCALTCVRSFWMERAIPSSQIPERETNRTAVISAILHAAFFIASLMIIPILAPSARIPNPFGPDEPSRRFFLENSSLIRLSDWLQLVSALCLVVLGCVWRRSYRESDKAQRATRFAVIGSAGSAVFLSLAAITSWALASPEAVDPGSAFRTLQFLPFLFGGPAWAAFFAMFMLGVTQASSGLLSKWMLWSGYGLTTTSVIATLVLITLAAAPFLPLTRFLGFVWLIAATILLNRAGRAQVSYR